MGDAGRPTTRGHGRHGDFENVVATHDPQRVSDTDAACGFRPLARHVDLARLDGLPRETARLEEARRPQPQIEPNRRRRGRFRHGARLPECTHRHPASTGGDATLRSMTPTKNLTEGPIGRTLFLFALPILAGN